MDSLRTFIAIELSPDVRARVAQHIASLRRELPDVRVSWSRADNLHLTLKFLGNVSLADMPRVSEAVASATKSVPSFELTLSDCGTFPPHGRPSVLWVGTRASSLQVLHATLEEALAEAGFDRESRPFRPHLTIGRLRHPQGARQLAELHKSLGFTPIESEVSEVVVFKSELLTQGPKHTAISRHELM